MSLFENKVAVVTGAGSGIGRCLALQLADHNCRLALSDINPNALEELLADLPSDTVKKVYIVDVASKDAVFSHADKVIQDFGRVDYVFNNAGATIVGTFEHLDIDEIDWQFHVNLWSVVYSCKAFLPIMRNQGSGCLVNISSVFGLISYPTQSAYNMSKFAVRALTECLWAELKGTNIDAVSVHPGGIRTNIEKASRRSRNANSDESVFKEKADRMLVTPPEQCAKDILRGLSQGRRRILTGKYSLTLYYLSRLFPNKYFEIVSRIG